MRHRGGGDNSQRAPSRPAAPRTTAITLERGITHDLEFEERANLVHPYSGDAAMDLVNYKKELTLEVMNEKGQVALRYFLHGCWVSEFTAVPDSRRQCQCDRDRVIKIELEGWERDLDTKEPDEAAPVPAG